MRQAMAATVVVALSVLTGSVPADEKKAEPTGTWKWEVEAKDQKREQTLKLKLEGDKLTGLLVAPDGKETAIEDAAFKDGEISFKVTRDRNGQKVTVRYTAKLNGDTLKGKIETDRDGQTRSRDWEAKRTKN